MSTLCSICQDFLTERPQTLGLGHELFICALRCGHLFHRFCVQQWFHASNNGIMNEGICPCCKVPASMNTALRIFPTGDEESDAMIRQDRDLRARNQALAVELEEKQEIIQRREAELEREMVSHDILKMEYVQLLSKMDVVQEQLNESKQMKLAVESSLKIAMEKVEKEKTEALEKVAEIERKISLQHKELTDEVETLKKKDEENQRKIEKLQIPQSSAFSLERLVHMKKLVKGINKLGKNGPTSLSNGHFSNIQHLDAESLTSNGTRSKKQIVFSSTRLEDVSDSDNDEEFDVSIIQPNGVFDETNNITKVTFAVPDKTERSCNGNTDHDAIRVGD